MRKGFSTLTEEHDSLACTLAVGSPSMEHQIVAVEFISTGDLVVLGNHIFISGSRNSGIQLSRVMRKPVFGVCDQLRLKPACSADETN